LSGPLSAQDLENPYVTGTWPLSETATVRCLSEICARRR
jgi:hypothetical protein